MENLQRQLQVCGLVQGIGFRPYVWRLARELGLRGWVRNDAAGVSILIQGGLPQIEEFTRRLINEIPPLGKISGLNYADSAVTKLIAGFEIVATKRGTIRTMIGPDVAVCDDCLGELFDPNDRRWRYAFINCTNCGPRYTITRALPYDRGRTCMADFPLCAECTAEYHNPATRRFHAEPLSCPNCGPHLWIEKPNSTANCADLDPIKFTVDELRAGKIVALKGIGGFHLAGDARNLITVQNLRQRKLRDAKPFALMVANIAAISEWGEINDAERMLLLSHTRPIVLIKKRPLADALFPAIAPGLTHLGVMLPYTPLHWLVFHEVAGRPYGIQWMQAPQELVLVMTSANPSGEPLVISNHAARERLAGIADSLLLHNREIVARCDDSVARCDPIGRVQIIRRARGYTPQALRLARSGPSVVALGGLLKNTQCITRGREAFVTQHIGGLDHPEAATQARALTREICTLLEIRPVLIAHDLQPDFPSTHHAAELARLWGVPTLAVQHHHAHIAAVVAEHGVTHAVIGLALDGVGMGLDRSAWGGELLLVNGAQWRRLGHLAQLQMPGGERAAREPWRMAAAVLAQLGRGAEISRRFATQPTSREIATLLTLDRYCPKTTSLGRWFDAAAGLLGVSMLNAYEGHSAMLLEALAQRHGVVPPQEQGFMLHADGTLDLLPLLSRLADEKNAALGAALFHSTVAHALAEWALDAAHRLQINTIALAGGCFLNQILTEAVTARIVASGVNILKARQFPPNDGGLSLGQAWVALQTLEGHHVPCSTCPSS